MSELLQDFKPGPLDVYRNNASFDWKKFKLFFDSEDSVLYQNALYQELQNHPAYSTTNTTSQNLDTQRYIAFKQVQAKRGIELLSMQKQLSNLKRPAESTRIFVQTSPSSFIKHGVGDNLFRASIMNMGTERHQHFINAVEDKKILGCYCLTEIGHGSNARGMRTTATYDKKKKVFVLNSPDFEAAKCWAGGLGQAASYGTIYAQLIIDGVNYGLHAFVVPIRNPKTLLPYPGLVVGDMGEKIGLNGIDNGFIQFDNYEIPRENLLNKVADVTEDGRYVTPIKDLNKRHGAALGSLSGGRVNITVICETLGIKALTIAIRYAAVRKQFGPEDKEEVPILEYQSHQHRLLPYLAAVFVIRNFNNFFGPAFHQFTLENVTGNQGPDAPEMGMEIHSLSSACKPVAGWIMKDAIQECRECCAGHGYLKAAGIGDIRNDHDANLTYEGENHVLIQQTSNYLLKFWPPVLRREKISSPLKSIDFLTNGLDILANNKFTSKTVEATCNPDNIIKAFQWLTCYLLKRSYEKLERETQIKGAFRAKNDSQVYYSKSLGIVYVQHYFIQQMAETTRRATDPSIRNVLGKLLSLYGLYSLERHISFLYQGRFAVGPEMPTLIQDSILRLCAELKNDAISLIDAVAPPDFILNSVLGASDGMVYKHLQSAIYQSPYAMSRPTWWQEIVNLKHKL